MKLLFISPSYKPRIGGVEKHVEQIAKNLVKKGHTVTLVTEQFENTKSREKLGGIEIIRLRYPKIKYFGLLLLWIKFLRILESIKNADVVHVHDVFIWYLPFRFLFPNKKVVTTFHGWEGRWPILAKNIYLKKMAARLSDKKIVIGKYIKKYYGINADTVMYGGTDKNFKKYKKIKNSIVYVGRLSGDTGLRLFLNDLKKKKYSKVIFIGDGELRSECEKFGIVTGFTDPSKYLYSAEYAVPGGYLSYIEARQNGCKITLYPDNKLKKDYWNEITELKKFQSWETLTNEYIGLYNNI